MPRQLLYIDYEMVASNVMRPDKMSLLRKFHSKIFFTDSNFKILGVMLFFK